jgi:hypothetical protein
VLNCSAIRIVFGAKIADDAHASHFMQHGMSVKSARRLFGGRFVAIACAVVFLPLAVCAQSPGRQFLKGHVPAVVSRLQPTGLLPVTNRLNLAIGLPLRNQQALDDLLQQIYDPASPNYHHYLTPEQFTEQFGPTEQDYQAVIAFAQANGLTVTTTYGTRLLLDVSSPAASVEKAFNVTIRVYRHPTENRTFYAPDIEPSVDSALPILDVSGLDNYRRPHPRNLIIQPSSNAPVAVPKAGSGPNGRYFGNDFREAYAPGVTLRGSGQTVGLVEFDGYYPTDITNYEGHAGFTNVPLQNVLLSGFSGTPTSDTNAVAEVSLDIEMAIAMAPALAKVVVFEGNPNPNDFNPIDVLSSMATNNSIKQLSCSWGWNGGPNGSIDTIFQEMAAQGQSFFNASGDSDAFTAGANSTNGVDNPLVFGSPSSSTNITQVGGTTLTTSGGNWSSETVWNWGYDSNADGYVGSSGGISSYYSIPSWQTNIDMTTNHGSTTMRNIPDVALTADNIYVYYNNGHKATFGGTSCAAPLWAGFTALVNQQAVAGGRPVVGFINPAIYAIGKSTNYTADFHDITTGDNTWSSSPTNFYAVPGYDLCTGWGTPAGQSLIDALTGRNTLGITPTNGFTASGLAGGPFSITAQVFSLTNTGTASLGWSLINTASWLNASPTNGTLVVGGQTAVTVSLNFAASNLVVGIYTADILFTNQTSGMAQDLQFTLQVVQPLVITPTNGFTASGPVGGPFSTTSQNFSLANIGATSLNWSLANTSVWLNASPTSGTLAVGGQTNTTVSLNPAVTNLTARAYTASLFFTNQTTGVAQSRQFNLLIGSIIQNGGFETHDFSYWTLSGNTNSVAILGSLYSHSGTWGAGLKASGSLGYISQTVPTAAGQNYLLSLWLYSPSNPTSGHQTTPNEFLVVWGGTTLFDQTNMPVIGWTNLLFIVTPTTSSTVLQFGFRDDPWRLCLDDVSLWPWPIAAPSFQSITQSVNTVWLNWMALTALQYQAQYRTNLTQGSWVNLGSPIMATNMVMTIPDVIGTDPQRFYRIQWVPTY